MALRAGVSQPEKSTPTPSAHKRPACACSHAHSSHPDGAACTRCKCLRYRERPRRTRGDGSLHQLADGTWRGRVELAPDRDGNRRVRWVQSRDRNQCIEKLRALRADVDAGRIATTSSTAVDKWMLHWIDNIHAKRKVRPGVIADYRACIINHINPAIGTKRVDKLTPQHIRDVHAAIGPRRTAELAHSILQRALKDAMAEGVATRNVAELVDKPEYKKAKRDGLPTRQAQHVITTGFTADESTAIRIAAGFLTGARRAELLGLRWAYVDLDTGLLDFSWQLQSLTQSHGCGDPLPEPSPLCRPDRPPKKPPYWPCGKAKAAYCPQRRWDLPPWFEYEPCERSLLFTRPKTDAGNRVVPAIPPLLMALRKLHAEQGVNPHGLVWHRGGRPIDPRTDYDMWRDVFRAADLIGPDESLPPHVARHTTASLLRAAGVDEQTRMEILGHASVDAQRGYAHADHARHLEAMGTLTELWTAPLGG